MTSTINARIAINSKSVIVIVITSSFEEKTAYRVPGTRRNVNTFVGFCQQKYRLTFVRRLFCSQIFRCCQYFVATERNEWYNVLNIKILSE